MHQELELMEKMEKNDKFIREDYRKLQEEYKNEFVAVDNGKVLDHDSDMNNLITKLKSRKKDLTLVLIHFIPEKGIKILF